MQMPDQNILTMEFLDGTNTFDVFICNRDKAIQVQAHYFEKDSSTEDVVFYVYHPTDDDMEVARFHPDEWQMVMLQPA